MKALQKETADFYLKHDRKLHYNLSKINIFSITLMGLEGLCSQMVFSDVATDGLGGKRGESPSQYIEGTSFSLSAEVSVPADGKQAGQPGNRSRVGRRHHHLTEPG